MRIRQIQELTRATERYPLLSDIPKEHLRTLLAQAEERDFDEDEIIFGEGVKSECLFLIASGKIALEILANGQRIVIQTLGAGDAMGWSALTRTARTHFQARALSRVQTIAFDGSRLLAAFEHDHSLGFRMMNCLLALVTERLDHTRMQIIDMYGKKSRAVSR